MQSLDSSDGESLLKKTQMCVRIPTSYSQEEIDAIIYKYMSEGWTAVDSVTTIGFISPDGSWFRGFDAPSRVRCDFPIEKAKRLGLCVKQEKSMETSKEEMP